MGEVSIVPVPRSSAVQLDEFVGQLLTQTSEVTEQRGGHGTGIVDV